MRLDIASYLGRTATGELVPSRYALHVGEIEAMVITASLRQVMGAVFWGFFGVRKRKAMALDVKTIKPAQLIVVGIVFAAIFVCALMLIVRLITHGL